MKQGDIVIIAFPFSNLTEKKLRPAVVLSNKSYNRHKNVILAGIYGKRTPCAVPLTNADLVAKKLRKQSFISLQNIFSIEQTMVGETIDSVNALTRREITRAFSAFIQ